MLTVVAKAKRSVAQLSPSAATLRK